jgi:hypothetical protein
MVTRHQIERLEQRIEDLADQRARQRGRQRRLEYWILDHGMATGETGEVVTEAELEARPYDGRRIVYTIVDPPTERTSGDTRAGAA